MDKITIQGAVAMADDMMPNSYSTEQKVRWLSDLDRKIYSEVFETHEGNEAEGFEGYDRETPLSQELLVPHPYAGDLYSRFLQLQMAAEQEETDSYNLNSALYNAEYSRFAGWYNRTHMPVNPGRLRF